MTSPTPSSNQGLAELDARLDGRVLRPGSEDYTAHATPWNLAVVNDHLAAVEVANPQDVVSVLGSPAEQGLEVAVRATGHGVVHESPPSTARHSGTPSSPGVGRPRTPTLYWGASGRQGRPRHRHGGRARAAPADRDLRRVPVLRRRRRWSGAASVAGVGAGPARGGQHLRRGAAAARPPRGAAAPGGAHDRRPPVRLGRRRRRRRALRRRCATWRRSSSAGSA